MILSRVIEHVRKQHWTAVLIDFVIVVVGVFIANQVTTWKEEADLSRRKAAAVQRLHVESEAIVAYMDSRTRDFAARNTDREEAMQRLSDGHWQGADTAKMSEALSSLDLAPTPSPPRSVYDELVSTGLIAEIGDARLRETIADYYAYLVFLQGQIDYVRQGFSSGPQLADFPGAVLAYDPKAFRGLRTDYDFEALSRDDRYKRFAVTRHADQMAQQQWWKAALGKAQAMCTELARYDGRPCAPKSGTSGKEIFGVADQPGS